MSVPPEHFARIAGRVDVALLATKLVVIVGVGTVGSQVARELANSGVGRLLLIDHDDLEEVNLVRHALPREYLGKNKSEAMAVYLAEQIPTLQPRALARKVDRSMLDNKLDQLLNDADLIVAATDDREAQRRVARRALALDIPAVLPALYGDNGGEVFVQGSSQEPCFLCWDGWRPIDERLRGVAALNVDALVVIQLAIQLSLGVLDSRSDYARLTVSSSNDPRPLQLFIQRRFAALEMIPQAWRDDCPSCAVGPAPQRVRDEAEAPEGSPARERVQSTARGHAIQTSAFLVAAAITIAVVAGLALLAAITTSKPPTSPSNVQREAAAEATAAKASSAANTRIAELSFQCIEEYVCEADCPNFPLPLFIGGLDERLLSYLEYHGYEDSWTDNQGLLAAQTIGSGASHSGSEGFVSFRRELPKTGGSGLIYVPSQLPSSGPGPVPEAVPHHGRWTITWRLKDSSGRVVKMLRYSVRVVRYNIAADGYCNKMNSSRLEANETGSSLDENEPYAASFYEPPPMFPYEK